MAPLSARSPSEGSRLNGTGSQVGRAEEAAAASSGFGGVSLGSLPRICVSGQTWNLQFSGVCFVPTQ